MSNLRNDSIDYKDKLYAHNFLLESPILSKVYALYIYNNDHKLISSYTKGSSLKSPFPYNLYGEESDEEENLKRYVENGTEKESIPSAPFEMQALSLLFPPAFREACPFPT